MLFDPSHSVQEDLESFIASLLTQRWTSIPEPVIAGCDVVLGYLPELLASAFHRELGQRFPQKFSPQSNNMFMLNRVLYEVRVELSWTMDPGYIVARVAKAHHSDAEQRFMADECAWGWSLSVNGARVKVARELHTARPVLLDIAKRVVNAFNHWLHQQLEAVSSRDGSTAERSIHGILRDEFKGLAERMMVYPYGRTKRGLEGTYALDVTFFGSLLERLRRSEYMGMARSKMLAGILSSTTALDRTESKRSLARKEPLLIKATQKGRDYAHEQRELIYGELAAYGKDDLISHPVLFLSESSSVQMVICYPVGLQRESPTPLKGRIDSLIPKFKAAVAASDSLAPLLRRIERQHFADNDHGVDRSERKSIVSSSLSRDKATRLLAAYIFDFVPTDGAHMIGRLQRVATSLNACRDILVLEQVIALLERVPDEGKLRRIENLLEGHVH